MNSDQRTLIDSIVTELVSDDQIGLVVDSLALATVEPLANAFLDSVRSQLESNRVITELISLLGPKLDGMIHQQEIPVDPKFKDAVLVEVAEWIRDRYTARGFERFAERLDELAQEYRRRATNTIIEDDEEEEWLLTDPLIQAQIEQSRQDIAAGRFSTLREFLAEEDLLD